MTLETFAALVGEDAQRLEQWEQGSEDLPGIASFAIQLLISGSDLPAQLSVPPKTLPLRIWYLYQNMPCTLIDADEQSRTVKIKNFTDRNLLRAFGVNTEPSYEDFEEFLKSRCFPESRDKMKILLDAMDLPFYSPLDIIEKTEGRMAEDHFRLIIERD